MALLPVLCSLVLADDPDKPTIGVVNINRVYESSLSRQQSTFFEEQERNQLQGKQELNERKMVFQQRLTKWKELQKEIAAANPDETIILQKWANDLKSNLRSMLREDEEYRIRLGQRSHPDPSVYLHRMRLDDTLKAARTVGEARGIDFLFNRGDEQPSTTDEEVSVVLYARESIDITKEAIAELRRIHGNEHVESEPIPRFGSFAPKYEPLLEKADLEENETGILAEPEQVAPDLRSNTVPAKDG